MVICSIEIGKIMLCSKIIQIMAFEDLEYICDALIIEVDLSSKNELWPWNEISYIAATQYMKCIFCQVNFSLMFFSSVSLSEHNISCRQCKGSNGIL